MLFIMDLLFLLICIIFATFLYVYNISLQSKHKLTKFYNDFIYLLMNALKCVKPQKLFRSQIKKLWPDSFTLTYTKCGIE